MQMDVPTGNCPGEAHFPHYGCGLAPCPCMHQCGHYPRNPYPYGRFEPPYRATEWGTRRSRSRSPIRSCKSKGKADAPIELDIKRTFLVDLDVDPHTPIPMIRTEPSSSRSRSPTRSTGKSRGAPDAQGEHDIKRGLFVALDVDPHTPISMDPVTAATGIAEEDDVSIRQSARHKQPVPPPPHNVIFKFQPLEYVSHYVGC